MPLSDSVWSCGSPALAPMIGGMVSTTVLTLLVIPVLYALWRGRSFPAEDRLLRTSDNAVQAEQESSR